VLKRGRGRPLYFSSFNLNLMLVQILVLESDVRRMSGCSNLTLWVQVLVPEREIGSPPHSSCFDLTVLVLESEVSKMCDSSDLTQLVHVLKFESETSRIGNCSNLALLVQVQVLESVRGGPPCISCSDLTLLVQMLVLENKNGVVVSSKSEATVFFSALI
jgi:hypothetical protein